MTWQRELDGKMRAIGFHEANRKRKRVSVGEPKVVTDVKQIVESAKAHGLIARRLPSKLEPQWIQWGLSHAAA